MTKRRLIIDTDPGVDDVFAILLAYAHPEVFELIALTTTAGNVGIEATTHNALGLKYLLGADFMVYQGAKSPLSVEFVDASDIHGKSGLGDYRFSETASLAGKEYAWDALYALARKNGGISLITLGPLTNIALCLLRYPDFGEYIDEVFAMGGAIGTGNTAPYSEFNFWCDPLAARIVFESGIPIHMIGLNATRQVVLNEAELRRVNPVDPELNAMTESLKTFYSERLLRTKMSSGFHLPDAVAVAAALDPSVVRYEYTPVNVVSEPGIKQGWTITDFRKNAKADTPLLPVAVSANKAAFVRLLLTINGIKRG